MRIGRVIQLACLFTIFLSSNCLAQLLNEVPVEEETSQGNLDFRADLRNQRLIIDTIRAAEDFLDLEATA